MQAYGCVTCLLEVEAMLNIVRTHVDLHVGKVLVQCPHASVVGTWCRAHISTTAAAKGGACTQTLLTDAILRDWSGRPASCMVHFTNRGTSNTCITATATAYWADTKMELLDQEEDSNGRKQGAKSIGD